jgi:hypothetical protein
MSHEPRRNIPASQRRRDTTPAIAAILLDNLIRSDGRDDNTGRGEGDAEREDGDEELHFGYLGLQKEELDYKSK